MMINVDCTIEELQARTAAIQNALNEDTPDKRHWLGALLPGSDEDKNPYEGLPAEEYNEKFEQWMDIYFEEYNKPRTKLLEQILDALLKEDLAENIYNELSPFLMNYMQNDTGGIQYKSALLLEKYSLNELVSAMLPLPENADADKIRKTFYTLNRFQYETALLPDVAEQLAEAMRIALLKEYSRSNPHFYVFNIVEKLAPQHPELLSKLQKELTDVLDIGHLDYREYDSALFMLKQAWPLLQPYWTTETIDALVTKIIEVIDDEFTAGDAFVEDGALRAIKVIGKGHPEAEKTIEWVEKELAEYYAEQENEQEL